MKMTRGQILVATAFVGAMACATAQAQQVPQPKTAAEVRGPVPGQIMTEEYARVVGRFAYMWAWPMIRAVQRSQLTHHFRRGSRPCRAAAYLS